MMTPNPNAPHFVLAAVTRIYPHLSSLIGTENWNTIQPEIDAYIRELEAQPNADLANTQLFGLLARYESARLRMAQELKVQEVITAIISPQMEQFAISLGIDPTSIDGLIAAAYAHMMWEVDPATIPAPEEDVRLKGITLRDGGIGGASVKFKKLQLDLGGGANLAAGFIATAVGIIAAPTVPLALPLLVVAGVLSTIGSLHNATKLELSEQEASVFWGMICAIGEMKGAGLYEATIVAATNAEREKYGLEPLKDAQMRHSLTKLERIKCIEKLDNTYRIIEPFTIKE
ncbi:MAG: hypothetical protein K8L97_27265 [Anaerolineae bacterium]|nr:hypothetical protein [Anaerolineae bacterium]